MTNLENVQKELMKEVSQQLSREAFVAFTVKNATERLALNEIALTHADDYGMTVEEMKEVIAESEKFITESFNRDLEKRDARLQDLIGTVRKAVLVTADDFDMIVVEEL